MNKAEKFLSDLTVYSKYSHFDHDSSKRKGWLDLVDTNENMHIKKHPQIESELRWAFDFVRQYKVLPSMRSMQYAGKPIEMNPARIYNCCYGAVNHPFFFAEVAFLLLSGTGVGYSVRHHHIKELPKIYTPDGSRRFLIGDSIEGWADSYRQLIYAFMKKNPLPIFDYSDIRKEGEPIKTSGGVAPGPRKLKESHRFITNILTQAVGRKLTSLECSDIINHIADAIVSGGKRDSALICLFDTDDTDMITSKGSYKIKNVETIETNTEGWKIKFKYQNNQLMNTNDYTGKDYTECFISNKYGDWDYKNAIENGSLPFYYVQPQRFRANISIAPLRGKTTEAEFREAMKRCEESGSGEPGVYWCNTREEGTNPCFTGDQILATQHGNRTLYDLWVDGGMQIYNKDKPIEEYGMMNIVNSNGIVKATNVYQTGGNVDVYEIKYKDGTSIKCTENHNHYIYRDGIKYRAVTKELLAGDIVKKNNVEYFGPNNDPEYALLAGWVIGMVKDGSISNIKAFDQMQTHIRCFEGDIIDVMPKLIENLKIIYKKYNKSTEQNPKYNPKNLSNNGFNHSTTEINSLVLGRLLKEDGLYPGNKHIVPNSIWLSDKETIANFLKGIFSADGTVGRNDKNCSISVRLNQSNEAFLKDIKLLLLQFGIDSSVHFRSKGKPMLMNGGKKMYNRKDNYELIMNGIEKCTLFLNQIGFIQDYKNERLSSFFKEHFGSNNSKTKFTTEILSVEHIGVENTYCLTEPINNEIVINGIITSQCAEVLFEKPFYFCNLTSQNVGMIQTQQELNDKSKAAAIIGTSQAGFTDFHYLRPIWKETTEDEALLGVSMTGIASGNVMELNLSEAAKIVVETNKEIAAKLGINVAARSTDIKPEGSGTLVVMTQGSGIHGVHDHFYFRNNRIKKISPIYKFLKDKFPKELMQDEFLNEDHVCIISMPMKAPKGAITRHEDELDLLERVKKFHTEWIKPGHNRGRSTHNVSCTVSIRPGNWDKVTDWMWENREHYSGISCFPFFDTIMKQAPFVTITEEEYNKAMEIFPNDVFLDNIMEKSTDVETTGEVACAGGACAI